MLDLDARKTHLKCLCAEARQYVGVTYQMQKIDTQRCQSDNFVGSPHFFTKKSEVHEPDRSGRDTCVFFFGHLRVFFVR